MGDIDENIMKNENIFEKKFKLQENNTSIKTELLSGFTSFMAMSYIIALTPNLLTSYGVGGKALWNGVFLSTCISSFLAMTIMGFLANKPFCLGPGIGLSTFVAIVINSLLGMTRMNYLECFQTILCIVLIEGVCFFAISIFSIRDKIVNSIPLGIRLGMSPGIGFMLLNIGFGSNIYIVNRNHNQFYIMRDFFGSLTANNARDTMTDAYPSMVLAVLTVFIGIFTLVALAHHKVKGFVVIGMLIASIFHWIGDYIFLNRNPFAPLFEPDTSFIPPVVDMYKTTLLKFNFKGLNEMGLFTAFILIITFCLIEVFQSIGAFVGISSRAGIIDSEGNIPNMKEAFISDSLGTIIGACFGTSTISTFIESVSGVEAGGRTGLTAIACGFCFLICTFLAPIASIIPAAATSSVLVYVGILMMSDLTKVNFQDVSISVPVTIMLIAMPISGSIGHAIGLAMISYTVIMILIGRYKEISLFAYLISLIFLAKFFILY